MAANEEWLRTEPLRDRGECPSTSSGEGDERSGLDRWIALSACGLLAMTWRRRGFKPVRGLARLSI
jgi:hypothetical protein